MEKVIILFLFTISIISKEDSYGQLTTPPPGNNRKAIVGERIGITDVLINYDRPGVKGREGKIYGTNIVHKGFIKPFFGTTKAAPWRAGANGEITIFSVPGGIGIGFSGQSVKFTNGKQLQRIGLGPDILVKPTIKGIRDGKDEVLERAVKFIETGK